MKVSDLTKRQATFGYEDRTYLTDNAILRYGGREGKLVDVSEVFHNTLENLWFLEKDGFPSVLDILAHAERIDNADTKWPLLVAEKDMLVLDGMHRLCKLMMHKKGKKLKVKIILLTDDEIKQIEEV